MITTKASYISTTTQFIEHWEGVNPPAPAPEITVHGFVLQWSAPIHRSDLQGLLDDLGAKRDAVSLANFNLAEARDDFKSAKELVVDKHGQLNGKIRGSLPGSKWERLSTPVASAEAGAEVVTKAATSAMNLWNRINSLNVLGEPLLLRDGVTAANFKTLRDHVQNTANDVTEAEQDLKDAVEERTNVEEKIYAVLKAYRQMIPQTLPVGHASIDSLPALTPPPGSTPDAVTLSGALNAQTNQAELTWDESTSADVTHYDVLGLAGPDFNEDNADLLGTVQKGSPRSFATGQFLQNPGSQITVKVYARTDSGHTAGSNAVTVTRPV